MITSKKLDRVIKRFERILPLAMRGGLDMQGSQVDLRYPCESPHCVAGWYIVASQRRKAVQEPLQEVNILSFSVGANLMAKDLGFDDKYSLTDWADTNRNIWGSNYGGMMFSVPQAYNGAKNMAEVVDYLKGVKARLEWTESR